MSNQTNHDQPAPGEARILSLTHAAGYSGFTLGDLRRNRSRVVASALQHAERAMGDGDATRVHHFLELADAMQHDGNDTASSAR